jgi:predicted phage baseplate assembly protein
VSLARGNLVLADHGRSLPGEALGEVPAPRLFEPASQASHCDAPPRRALPVRFRPALANGPITQAAPAVLNVSAAQALRQMVDEALPSINLTGTLLGNAEGWQAQRSLLNSGKTAPEFVVEVEDDGLATLRFGDDTYGKRPDTGTAFEARYRVGNGSAGNLGAESLVHVVGLDVGAIVGVRNPLHAQGGVERESAESVRRRAPEAFRTQERAVTPADYTEVTQRFAGVQRAATRLRWTGSWHTVFVTVDRSGGVPLDGTTRAALASHLDRYRMAGHDVAFEEPVYVSLEIALHVCVKPDYFRPDVRAGLIELFSNRVLSDGRRGLFHPDNFSFGQLVYLSPLIAAAHQVPGVASVEVISFGPQGDDDPTPLDDGQLVLGPREIARLDNDANFPEHGVLALELHGGK